MSDPSKAERGVHVLGSRLLRWYAVEDGGKLTLFDGGLVGYWRELEALLKRLQRGPSDVAALVVSHGHADHFGIAARLRAATPSVRILVHEADRRALMTQPNTFASRALPPIWRPMLFRYTVHLIRNGMFRTPTVRPVETFADGDELDVPGRPIVVHAPGHTPGNSAFVLADRGVLLSGDALITIDPAGHHRARVALEATSLDRTAARTSLERLRTIDADLVLPGHGDPWHGSPEDAVMEAIA